MNHALAWSVFKAYRFIILNNHFCYYLTLVTNGLTPAPAVINNMLAEQIEFGRSKISRSGKHYFGNAPRVVRFLLPTAPAEAVGSGTAKE